MKVGILVDVEPGIHGGIATALRSLITALGKLEGPETYVLLVESETQVDWLSPLAPNQRFEMRPAHTESAIKKTLRAVRDMVNKLAGRDGRAGWPIVPLSSGYFESLGLDVIHFPTQGFTYCAIPSVYNPHDLQHLHYPQFFEIEDLAWRETIYRAACRTAHAIIVNSQWIKDDVVAQFAVSPAKVQVIPEAAPTQLLADVSDEDKQATRTRYNLPDKFIFYPNNTWPHKNHLRLVESLALLRDKKGLTVPLVSTGARHEPSREKLDARIRELGLESQVHFLGFVSTQDLRALYQMARCLVVPSLFEANSLPIFEAWAEGIPVASSNVTALPEQVGDAGLLFDPFDPADMGAVIERLFTDDALCADLVTKGTRRLSDFDFLRTARANRALYRRAAGRPLDAEDKKLLSTDWMRNPERG
ncbi:glycosyltransferase family 4 protein [Hyphomonas johnsonii]|uniref:Group 1 glycosyl transferase n=1 Tax=Hyphomonas johnsonii MHS-2 TaxID=1280950 RepID=A0A059FVV3_9PROT|nr:glycosyltransferase family 1 protein [Hyphomonas johnsonii]KCZ94543.1 group 1 glycosyl transferase [Hyphomonas johnsonii MHS-2]